MLKITVDFETRSESDLKKVDAWRYSEDLSTEIICFAFKVNDKKTDIWYNPKILPTTASGKYRDAHESLQHIRSGLKNVIEQGAIFEAHNAEFERAIIENVAVKKLGWPTIPIKQWRCSAAKAASFNLPRALNDVCKVLKLPINKDMDGHVLMLRLSSPIKYENGSPVWDEDPGKIKRLGDYCKQDVDSEYGFSESLKDLSPIEQNLWFVDQLINQRGIKVDLDAINSILKMINEQKTVLLEEFQDIIKSKDLISPTQTQKMLTWFNDHGLNLPNMQAETIEKALEIKNLSPETRRVLELRTHLSKASTAKYDKALEMVCKDGRIRGLFMFAGAGPGRWAGKGLQVHNLPRGTYKESQTCIDLIDEQDFESVSTFFDPPMIAAKKLIRSILVADNGNELIAADYSSIEGRGLAWLANERYVLDNYETGKDAYVVFASQMHPEHTYDEILKGYKANDPVFEEMRFDGKTGELACGYRGGEKAVKRFAPNMLKKKRKRIVRIWRANRPLTVHFWDNLQAAAIHTVKTGNRTKVDKISFGRNKQFLQMRLPSGRIIYYFNSSIIQTKVYAYRYVEIEKTKAGESIEVEQIEYSSNPSENMERYPKKDFITETIQYYATDENQKWVKQTTHGGKLAENATQGVARDFLAEALIRLEKSGFPVVLHVHDEAVAEVKIGSKKLADFERIMSIRPLWAQDCPIVAKGWIGKRYRK